MVQQLAALMLYSEKKQKAEGSTSLLFSEKILVLRSINSNMLANVSLNGYKFDIIKAPLTSLQAIWEVKDWICRRGESG